jgi:hypothetical protein
MARVRRYGYIVEWFIGDHVPRHVHVYDSKGRMVGRLDVDRLVGIEGWRPDQKLIKLIGELKHEGRL